MGGPAEAGARRGRRSGRRDGRRGVCDNHRKCRFHREPDRARGAGAGRHGQRQSTGAGPPCGPFGRGRRQRHLPQLRCVCGMPIDASAWMRAPPGASSRFARQNTTLFLPCPVPESLLHLGPVYYAFLMRPSPFWAMVDYFLFSPLSTLAQASVARASPVPGLLCPAPSSAHPGIPTFLRVLLRPRRLSGALRTSRCGIVWGAGTTGSPTRP